MIEPPLSAPDAEGNVDLVKRITQRMLQDQLDQQIVQTIKQGFDRIINSEPIIRSRPERIQIYKGVVKALLTQIIDNLDLIE